MFDEMSLQTVNSNFLQKIANPILTTVKKIDITINHSNLLEEKQNQILKKIHPFLLILSF